MTEPIKRATDKRSMPLSFEPVWVLIHPTANGLTNPAKLAMELISAIPPAAVTPERNAVGNVQKMGNAAVIPIVASTMAANSNV